MTLCFLFCNYFNPHVLRSRISETQKGVAFNTTTLWKNWNIFIEVYNISCRDVFTGKFASKASSLNNIFVWESHEIPLIQFSQQFRDCKRIIFQSGTQVLPLQSTAPILQNLSHYIYKESTLSTWEPRQEEKTSNTMQYTWPNQLN